MGATGVDEWLAMTAGALNDVNLRAAVLQRIRLGIVSGKIKPGEILTVPTLAKTWEVSSTPVREALLELSAAGLIEPLRNRGFKVVAASADDLRDLFGIRVQLELFAVSLIVDVPQKERALLMESAQDIANAVTDGDTIKYLASDRAFHYCLVSLGGNPRLTSMVMSLRDNMRLYGIESPAGLERQSHSVAEHFDLIDLVCAKKLEEASTLLRRHILDWEPIFKEAIQAF